MYWMVMTKTRAGKRRGTASAGRAGRAGNERMQAVAEEEMRVQAKRCDFGCVQFARAVNLVDGLGRC
jgi:hypothetical protein